MYVYRFDPPALVEFSEDLQIIGEIPFSVPLNCGLFNILPAPLGKFMAIELSCPNGQTVLFLDSRTHSVTQPVSKTDSHFLSWTRDGDAVYLKVDSLGNTQILRVFMDGRQEPISISPLTYDLAPSPNGDEFTFTFSGGLGQGSELWLSGRNGSHTRRLYADPLNYISFARYSPNGTQIAFIKIPDTQTPFTTGELWVMDHDGSNAHKLADADAGHGFAASWSPDGKRLAVVMRENPDEQSADQSVDALISNIYTVDLQRGTARQVTYLEHGRTETPLWSPDGNTLAFTVVIDDRMEVQIADVGRAGSTESGDSYRDPTGEIRSLRSESTCCPAWMRK